MGQQRPTQRQAYLGNCVYAHWTGVDFDLYIQDDEGKNDCHIYMSNKELTELNKFVHQINHENKIKDPPNLELEIPDPEAAA
jgi:hypothetical protein